MLYEDVFVGIIGLISPIAKILPKGYVRGVELTTMVRTLIPAHLYRLGLAMRGYIIVRLGQLFVHEGKSDCIQVQMTYRRVSRASNSGFHLGRLLGAVFLFVCCLFNFCCDNDTRLFVIWCGCGVLRGRGRTRREN